MNSITAITTFPSVAWDLYARQMLQSFVQYWPAEVSLLVALDDDLVCDMVRNIVNREGDATAVGWTADHAAFVARNKGRDDPQNYRMQPVRFCHKVFVLKRALDAIQQAKANGEPASRYLIWLDADVHTTRLVTIDEIRACLPKEGEAVAYMGRKDWDHSECGWLAFDLEASGDLVINEIYRRYVTDQVLSEKQWHDSWMFDRIREYFGQGNQSGRWTNLTPQASGLEVWPQSPMGKWSVHYKGPAAKATLGGAPPVQPQQGMQRVIVQTKNALPDEEIQAQIAKNQSLIKNWIRPCKEAEEEIVVVSAGPMLVAEDVREEGWAGKRIVAVKNALVPLKKAGVKPWACILLDPRAHVADFVQDADPSILWFVASQVNPAVTLELLARGCTVWGYHAAVNAGEERLIEKQLHAVINGGSATATRGLYVLNHLGFSRFHLYGYDLCMTDKPDLNEMVEIKENGIVVSKHPKYMELSVGMSDPLYSLKRMFWSEPQFIAQFEELNQIIQSGKFKLRAHGDGVLPFMIKAKNTADLRRKELQAKIAGENPPTYMELLSGPDAANAGTGPFRVDEPVGNGTRRPT